jgi:DNA-directed RNA polymerase III subunit RPC7
VPKELQPNHKRTKKDGTGLHAKKAKTVQDVEQKLKLLEQKEKTTPSDNANDAAKSDDDEEVNYMFLVNLSFNVFNIVYCYQNDGEENMDDEMDDENDYGGNYFDNGEAYNEEDDNLDDGPVY